MRRSLTRVELGLVAAVLVVSALAGRDVDEEPPSLTRPPCAMVFEPQALELAAIPDLLVVPDGALDVQLSPQPALRPPRMGFSERAVDAAIRFDPRLPLTIGRVCPGMTRNEILAVRGKPAHTGLRTGQGGTSYGTIEYLGSCACERLPEVVLSPDGVALEVRGIALEQHGVEMLDYGSRLRDVELVLGAPSRREADVLHFDDLDLRVRAAASGSHGPEIPEFILGIAP